MSGMDMGGKPFMHQDMKGVTQEEVSKLTKAMKSGEFRDHMEEYTREISDPKNRREYMQYLEQLESKGEMPEGQQLLRAEPGCCLKTKIKFKNGQLQKCFINVCHTDRLDDLEMQASDAGSGKQAKLPFSLGPPRPDRDLKDEYCMTCDCAVSSRTFYQAVQFPHIMKCIFDTAADGLTANFLKGHEEVSKDFKIMTKLKCKGGFPYPMSVKAELLKDKGTKSTCKAVPDSDGVTPSELKQMRDEAKAKKTAKEDAIVNKRDAEEARREAAKAAKTKKEEEVQRIRVPKHRLIHSGSVDLADYMESKNQPLPTTSTVPKTLRLIVELPSVKKSSDVTLEVTSNNIVVEVPEKYYLDLPLSYEVEEEKGTAKFDKTKQELTLELPVVPKPPVFRPEAADNRGGSDDDGGISDRGDESEEDLPLLEKDSADGVANGDWIDAMATDAVEPQVPPESPLEQPAPQAPPSPPRREKLEIGSLGSSLQIAQAVEPPEELLQEFLGEDAPEFFAADAWQGARPGYYFSLGGSGLGYYRDRVQEKEQQRSSATVPAGVQLGRKTSSSATPEASQVALVQEVHNRPPPEGQRRVELPPAAQQYVDSTEALYRRLKALDGVEPAQEELHVESHQNLQNVFFFVELRRAQEVADLQLALSGHSLSLSVCTRAGPQAAWRRHRLRRVLEGAVDARQWHAETRWCGAGLELSIVLRKVRLGEMWSQVFDSSSATAALDSLDPLLADGETAEAPADDLAAAIGEASTDPEEEDAAAAQALEQDSAELDVASLPEAGAAMSSSGAHLVGASAGGAQPTAAMVQSATIMGQSVLLSNRLLYQLL